MGVGYDKGYFENAFMQPLRRIFISGEGIDFVMKGNGLFEGEEIGDVLR